MKLKVGVVLSHPFHVGLGTDFRLLNQVYPLSEFGIELKVVSPFRMDPPNLRGPIKCFCLSSCPAVYEQMYKTTRFLFNRPFLARQALRSIRYLEWSANSYSKKLSRFLARENVDVLLAVHQLAAAACSRVRTKFKVPVIADIHGVWSEEIVASGCLRPGSKQAAIVQKFEAQSLENVDKIVVVSDELASFLSEKYGIPRKKIKVINPCTFPKVAHARKSHHLSKIVCSGTSTYREGLDLLIRSIPLVLQNFPKSQLFLTKKGDILSRVQRLARELDVHPNYFYFPQTSNFYDFLKECDIGIVTSSMDVTRVISYPAKLYEYFSVGLPVVANDVGGWTRIIKEAGAGIVTDSTPQALAEGICDLIRNPEKANEFGNNGLDYLRSNLKPERVLEGFHDVLVEAMYS